MYRRAIFQQNLALIMQHDAESEGYGLGLTKFSDWTEEEFASIFKLSSNLTAE
jgi:Cathepsin propeptide inhibitor domain (I29)